MQNRGVEPPWPGSADPSWSSAVALPGAKTFHIRHLDIDVTIDLHLAPNLDVDLFLLFRFH